MPAKADDTVNFRIIGHANSVQSQEVGDVDGHALILARLSGLTLFPDGAVGRVYWTVQADYINSVGPYLAYVNVTLPDGSVLWYKSTGLTGETTTGSVNVVGGKGSLESANGNAAISGARVGPPGADVYFDLVINIKK